MSEEIRLVDAVTQEHFAVMSRIHAEGWRVAYKDMLSEEYFARVITDDHWIPIFSENYAQGKGFGLLAYRGETPLGCIVYGPARAGVRPDGAEEDMQIDAYAGWGEIHSFYSVLSEIGKGYGKKLMTEALARLRAQGYQHCFVLANRDKPLARKFYSDYGFAPDGTEIVLDYEGRICYDLRYTIALS